jgi:hypothetical protein
LYELVRSVIFVNIETRIVDCIYTIGDLWILITIVSPHHKVRFFLLGVGELFFVGDKVMWVEHTRKKFKILVLRLGKDFEGEWMWNFEHEDKMYYSLQQVSIGLFIF